jgi:hypothetical protein
MNPRRGWIEKMKMVLGVKLDHGFVKGEIRPQSSRGIKYVFLGDFHPEIKPNIRIFIEFQKRIKMPVQSLPPGLAPEHLPTAQEKVQGFRQQKPAGGKPDGSSGLIPSQLANQKIRTQINR